MPESSIPPLPHGATGFDLGGAVIQFLRDKIVFSPKHDPHHYTLHAGQTSRTVDIHQTREDVGLDEERHKRLFAMGYDQLCDALNDLHWLAPDFFSLIRPLSLNWIKCNNIQIVRGLHPVTDDDIKAVTKPVRRKRLVLDEEKLAQSIDAPDCAEAVHEFPSGAFSLFQGRHEIGVGFKATLPDGGMLLRWIKLSDLRRFIRTAEPHVMQAIKSRAISQEEHGSRASGAPPGPGDGLRR